MIKFQIMAENSARNVKYPIRTMVKEDLAQVNEIDHEAFPTQWPPPNYRQELQNRIAFYIVMSDSSRTLLLGAVGKKHNDLFSRLMPWRKEPVAVMPEAPAPQFYIVGFSGIWMMAGEAHITNIAVRQEYRGRGLGELLLLATIDLAMQQNASFLTLECRASNIVAQGLYNKYGFVQMGIRKGYYLDNREDAIIMSTEMIANGSFQERVRGLKEALDKKLK
jgi:[ribosomal protein S18]-alanine N-acetyltransferase